MVKRGKERSTLSFCSASLALLAATLPNILLEKTLVLDGILANVCVAELRMFGMDVAIGRDVLGPGGYGFWVGILFWANKPLF